jgi:hypothetical protein
MIKRTYFCRFRKFSGDGTGSYADNSFTIVAESLFAEHQKTFEKATEWAADHLKNKLGNQVLCMAFNRL